MTFWQYLNGNPTIAVLGGFAVFFVTLCVLGLGAEILSKLIERNKPEPKE